MSETQVLVADGDATAHVRIVGRGTYAVSHPLREYLLRKLRAGTVRYDVDLTECPGLDSTFIGLLALLAVEERTPRARVELINAGDKVVAQIEGLGMRDFFSYARSPAAGLEWRPVDAPPLDARARSCAAWRTMRDAHEALVAAVPANRPRFRHVLDVLRAEEEQHAAADAGQDAAGAAGAGTRAPGAGSVT